MVFFYYSYTMCPKRDEQVFRDDTRKNIDENESGLNESVRNVNEANESQFQS